MTTRDYNGYTVSMDTFMRFVVDLDGETEAFDTYGETTKAIEVRHPSRNTSVCPAHGFQPNYLVRLVGHDLEFMLAECALKEGAQ